MSLMSSDKKPVLSYQISRSLYLNVTQACTANCFFCPREENPVVQGYDLKLDSDPTAEELIQSVGDPRLFEEVVFCGFGEPLLRLETVLEVARWLKGKKAYVRLDTNGHGNLIYNRPVASDLAGLVDEVCVSLNATNTYEYTKIMNPAWGETTFEKVIEFIMDCKKVIPKVVLTAVDFPGFDRESFEKFAEEDLRLPFRIRRYNELGEKEGAS